MSLKESLSKPVGGYASGEYVHVSQDSSVLEAARVMREGGSTEALVMSSGRLSGIVTERDILYKVVAEGLDPSKTRVGSVMSAPVETIPDTATVGDAIAKMTKLGIRRLCVMKQGRLAGLVTQRTLVAGKLGTEVPLPELAKPGYTNCPYCGAQTKDGAELYKHIDRVHIGVGVLEGSLEKA
jgi:CBS domain-containing protein